jgi:hypothetical protein
MTHRLDSQIPITMAVEKTRFMFFYLKTHFQPIFLPQKSKKHHKNLVKSIHDLKKNTLKPETKNLYGLIYVF